MYSRQLSAQIEQLNDKKDLVILGIESSCDETAAAVVRGGREVLSNVVFSQIPLHTVYGGVVPEIASRAHVEKIDVVARQALEQASLTLKDLDAVAVTYGPGLVGALLVGVSYAKALAFSIGKPLLGVNHIEGHIAANYITHPTLNPPALCLVVSGGHSHILYVSAEHRYRLIGCTQDDAAGEAFDKAARVLGLSYPGGPRLDKAAESGNDAALKLPVPKLDGAFDFSFSGLKTAFINALHQMEQQHKTINTEDMAASFRKAVVDLLVEKTMRAAQHENCRQLLLAGGVSANSLLRRRMAKECAAQGIDLYMPDLSLCGDNAAMIAAAGYLSARRGEVAGLALNAVPSLRIV